jgi:hypothetical protein
MESAAQSNNGMHPTADTPALSPPPLKLAGCLTRDSPSRKPTAYPIRHGAFKRKVFGP